MQHKSAQQLDVERALAERALRRFAHERERLHGDLVERRSQGGRVAGSPARHPLPERQAFRGQFGIRKRRPSRAPGR